MEHNQGKAFTRHVNKEVLQNTAASDAEDRRIAAEVDCGLFQRTLPSYKDSLFDVDCRATSVVGSPEEEIKSCKLANQIIP